MHHNTLSEDGLLFFTRPTNGAIFSTLMCLFSNVNSTEMESTQLWPGTCMFSIYHSRFGSISRMKTNFSITEGTTLISHYLNNSVLLLNRPFAAEHQHTVLTGHSSLSPNYAHI